jgi:hypothetical protein
MVDGVRQLDFPNGPGSDGIYLAGGDHLVNLVVPSNCTVNSAPRSVNLDVGGLTRDTVEVSLSAECVPEARLRVTAPTTGPLPNVRYTIGLCNDWNCDYYGTAVPLGDLAPNDTLITPVRGMGILEIGNIPSNCVARTQSIQINVKLGDTLDVKFPVQCTP